MERILDLASPARVSVRTGRLIVQRHEGEEVATPLLEVAAVIAAHRQVVFTQSALTELMEHGGVFVACDGRSLPAGMMLPLNGHHLQAERFARQAQASLPTKKRLWQQLVRAKVRAQGRLLNELHADDSGLSVLAEKVRSGDPSNVEAQASRRYWGALFKGIGDGEFVFRRKRDGDGPNALLNYGYGVLRGLVGRAVCGSGLHPSLGIHHHNRYDSFCLVDDLMEPYRPIVDRAVQRHAWTLGRLDGLEVDKEAKRSIFAGLFGRFDLDGEQRTIFDVLSRTTVSLVQVYAGERKDLAIPEV